jgi:hypothetical protein
MGGPSALGPRLGRPKLTVDAEVHARSVRDPTTEQNIEVLKRGDLLDGFTAEERGETISP